MLFICLTYIIFTRRSELPEGTQKFKLTDLRGKLRDEYALLTEEEKAHFQTLGEETRRRKSSKGTDSADLEPNPDADSADSLGNGPRISMSARDMVADVTSTLRHVKSEVGFPCRSFFTMLKDMFTAVRYLPSSGTFFSVLLLAK